MFLMRSGVASFIRRLWSYSPYHWSYPPYLWSYPPYLCLLPRSRCISLYGQLLYFTVSFNHFIYALIPQSGPQSTAIGDPTAHSTTCHNLSPTVSHRALPHRRAETAMTRVTMSSRRSLIQSVGAPVRVEFVSTTRTLTPNVP